MTVPSLIDKAKEKRRTSVPVTYQVREMEWDVKIVPYGIESKENFRLSRSEGILTL